MGDEAFRSHFPISFGKQTKSETPLDKIHTATLRHSDDSAATSAATDFLTAFNHHPNSKKPNSNTTKLVGPSRGPNGDDGGVVGPSRGPEEDDGAFVGPPVAFVQEEEDGDIIGPPRPPASIEEEEEDDGPVIGPPRPADSDEEAVAGPTGPPEGSDSDDEMGDYDVEESQFRIPKSNEIVLKGHTKVISTIAIDHSGSRVITGSYDYSVRMYDFQGMNARLQSFRQFEPFEGHQVRTLSWSPTSGHFLCVTGSAQAKIYDRDGITLGEFAKGDMYIRDLQNTKGHISGLTCGEWHPKTKETILTSSEDGSLRIWDVNNFTTQKQVLKPKLARPGRVPVTTCAWDCEGKSIAGGIGDGSIQIWKQRSVWASRPDIVVPNAHSDDITALKFSTDGSVLLSRSFDNSLKVWDLRKMKDPLRAFQDLPNLYAQTNVAFSPDEKLILTGTSVEKDSTTGGLLCFYDREKLELVSRIGISPCSVVQCAWHPRLNQILATSGDKHQGETHVLYDPSFSVRGALVCVARAPRKKSVDDYEAPLLIHNPHALPLFRDAPSRKRQREKILKDPLKSRKPEVPVNGPGFGGRVGTTKGSLLTQYLLKKGGSLETWQEEDPREAILKYADVAKKDPKYIAPAYADTQPETFFAKSDSEDDEK